MYTINTLWRTKNGQFIKLKDANDNLLNEIADWVHRHDKKYDNFINLLTIVYTELNRRKNESKTI